MVAFLSLVFIIIFVYCSAIFHKNRMFLVFWGIWSAALDLSHFWLMFFISICDHLTVASYCIVICLYLFCPFWGGVRDGGLFWVLLSGRWSFLYLSEVYYFLNCPFVPYCIYCHNQFIFIFVIFAVFRHITHLKLHCYICT